MRIRTPCSSPSLALLAALLAACGGDRQQRQRRHGLRRRASPAATGEGVCAGDVTDLLKEVCDKGTLTVSTDPAYPPQSSLNEQTGKYEGFDIDVATEIAKRLGVEVAWETPAWDVITAGSWNGRWDTTVGSMTPTNDRQKVLYFTEPYYYTPAVVVVERGQRRRHTTSSTDLDGKKIGVCSGCTYEQYLEQDARDRRLHLRLHHRRRRDLTATTPTRPRCRTWHSETAPPRRGDHVGDDRPGLHRRRQPGARSSATRCSTSRSAVGFDKSSDPSTRPACSRRSTRSSSEMHEDGTLTALSKKWYGGADLTDPAVTRGPTASMRLTPGSGVAARIARACRSG